MSRKADIQAEETALNSPLRRSSRRTALTNSPAPTTLSSRRNSQSQTDAIETKTPKTRRASQEQLEKNEITENRPTARGRRVSTDEKTEPAKTRSRRSSAATEPLAEETEKKHPIARRRRSTPAEEQPEPENVKTVKSRRNSAKDTPVEEDTVKKPVRSRRNSAKEEETKKEPPKKILRSRRGSAAEEAPETDTKEKEALTRGRRSSTDKLDDEPDTKIAKLTPVKSKRRLSITENVVNLEPIVEQESETKGRKSTSPLNSELKKSEVSLSDVKLNRDAKTNLDLSTIEESSFTEESLNKSTSEKIVLTPRKSPRLNKEKKLRDSNGSLTPSTSSTMDKENVDKTCTLEKSEIISKEAKETIIESISPKQIKEANKNSEETTEQVDLENESVEFKSKEHTINEAANESLDVIKSEDCTINKSTDEDLDKNLPSSCKKLDFENDPTEEINAVKFVEPKEVDNIDIEEDENVETEYPIHDKSDSNRESIDQSILETECEQEKEHIKQIVVEDKIDTTLGSDESFKFQLNVSNLENQEDNVEDNLNTSKNSSSSDKENIEMNSSKTPNSSKVNIAHPYKKIKSLTESSDHNIRKEVEIVVGRLSNVFRPTMKEHSFVEPMEVDESIWNITEGKSLDLEESDITNASLAVSTPIVERCIEKIENSDHNTSTEDVEEITQKQSITIAHINGISAADEPEIISEVITVDSEFTLEESEAVYISKQELMKEGQVSDSLSKDTADVGNLETIEGTGQGEHGEICESSLSEEELGEERSDKAEEKSFEIVDEIKTEEILLVKTPQIQQADVTFESKSTQQMTSEKMIGSIDKECFSKALESEAQDIESNSSGKSEIPAIQHTNIDELENEAEKSSRDAKGSLIRTLFVELENKPTLMKSESPQPDHPSDELKGCESGISIRKSMSPLSSKNLEVEVNTLQRCTSRELRSPGKRQETGIDQNKKNSSSRKSKSPQPQIINTGELKSASNETPLQKIDIPKSDEESLNVELDQDKVCSRKSKSPQPEHEEITKEREISLASKKLNMPELNNSPEMEMLAPDSPKQLNDSESESEAQILSPVRKEHPLQESPEFEESRKTDISEDYEFEIPSDEEEVDKSHKLEFEEDTMKSDQLVASENTCEDDTSIIRQVQKPPSPSPLKRKSVDAEMEPSKKNKLAPISASSCEITSPDKLPVSDEFMNIEATVNEPTNKEDVGKYSDLIEREKASSQNIHEVNVNKSDKKELFLVTETEIVEDCCADETNIDKDIPNQKEVIEVDDISIQNEVENDSVFVGDTDENVNTKSNLTFKKGSAQEDVIEVESSGTEDELVQNFSDVEEENKRKKKSTTAESSVNSIQDDASMENTSSNDAEAFYTNKECDIMETDLQDVIQDSSVVKEGEKVKETSKMINESLLKDTQIEANLENASSNADQESSLMESDSSEAKKGKKIKKMSKANKKSSRKTIQIDGNIENASSNDAKTFYTSEECDIMETDLQDVIQDSSVVKEGKRGKEKSKMIKKSSVKNTQIEANIENASSNADQESNLMESDSSRAKKGKKIKKISKANQESSVKTIQIDSNIENDSSNDSKKTYSNKELDIIESDSQDVTHNFIAVKKEKGKKKSKKRAGIAKQNSSVGANNEEEFNSTTRKEKKKTVQDITYLEHERDTKNQKKQKPLTRTEHVDSIQDDSPRKQASGGLEAFALSKLDEYLSAEISGMGSEDESYSTSATEEEDNSEEDNGFLDTMAEEGEEDTPSEGSNDIIDEGESIHSTESEMDSDESYDLDDPFICDDEEVELLSGEEYDLGNEKNKKKEKKSRIIQLDDCDDEIIKINKKEKPVKKNKRSRIIPVSESSDSESDKNCDQEALNTSSEEINGAERTFEVKEEDDDVIILEERSTPIKFSNNQMALGLNSLNTDTPETLTKKKKKSIIIHENINVAEIKNPDFSEKIASVVDTFCHQIYGGEISMNLSLEHAVDNTEASSKHDDVFIKRNKRDKHFIRNSRDNDGSGESAEEKHWKKQQRLSTSLNDIEDTGKPKQRSRKKRKSASLDNLSASKSKKNKVSRDADGNKKDMEKTSHSKKKFKSQYGIKPPRNSAEDLRAKTSSIMDELITDVKNRPVRTIKPSTTVTNMNGSWISEVADVKPSTTLSNRVEAADYKAGKIHPKDFRSKMLYDSSRVRRVDTKTMLRKRGAYF